MYKSYVSFPDGKCNINPLFSYNKSAQIAFHLAHFFCYGNHPLIWLERQTHSLCNPRQESMPTVSLRQTVPFYFLHHNQTLVSPLFFLLSLTSSLPINKTSPRSCIRFVSNDDSDIIIFPSSTSKYYCFPFCNYNINIS